MTKWHSHDTTIFTNKDALFEGINQSFDPHAEPNSAVPYAMDINFADGKLNTRDGYAKILGYYASILSMAETNFGTIAIHTADGEIIDVGI